MPLDTTGYSYPESKDTPYLDTTTTNLALDPYGQVSTGYNLNEYQRECYADLEKSIKSKVRTLAAKLHVNSHILDEVASFIEAGNTFAAETALMQVVDTMKRVRLDETKMEYYEAIHAYIRILSLSNFGNQIEETNRKVRETLDA